MSFPGWETLDTVVTSLPEKRLLPEVAVATWFDPRSLLGVGALLPAVTPKLGASTCTVRSVGLSLEATFRRPEVFGTVLLDSFIAEAGAPCSLLLEIFGDDRETVLWEVGTAQSHATPYLVEPTAYAEQVIDVAAGGATLGQVTVEVVDRRRTAGDQDSGWVTQLLASLGLANLHGRRARLRRWISEELGFVVLADGPCSTARLVDYSAFAFGIRDTRETERKVRLFDNGGGIPAIEPGGEFDPTGAKTLVPDGVFGGYGFDADEGWLIDPAEPVLGRWSLGSLPELNGDDVALVNLESDPGNPAIVISTACYQAMEGTEVVEGVLESLGGDDWQRPYQVRFANLTVLWRAAGTSDPWNEIPSSSLVINGLESDVGGFVTSKRTNLALTSPYPTPEAETGRTVHSVIIGDSRGLPFHPVDDDAIELLVIYRGPPSKDLPVYVEGLTAGEFARNVYAGLYSLRDEAGYLVPTGIRYDEAAVLAITDVVRMRITEPITDARDWLEGKIYAPTGWVPALDDLGQISPVSQVAPLSVVGLPVITDAITEPTSDWNSGERIVNVIRFIYPRDYRPSNPANAETGDGLRARSILLEYRDPISVERHGRQVLEISGEAFRAIGNASAEPVTGSLADEAGYALGGLRQIHVQNRYTLGAPTIAVPVMRLSTLGLRAGSWVAVDLSWLPDYVTGTRGLIAMAQVVALGDLDCAWRQLTMEVVVPLLAEGS